MAPTPIPSPFAYDGLLYINGGRSAGLYAIKPGGKGDLTPGKDVGGHRRRISGVVSAATEELICTTPKSLTTARYMSSARLEY